MISISFCMLKFPICEVPPELVENPTNVTASVGDTVKFRCNVTGSPLPAVWWQQNGITLDVLNTSIEQSSSFLSSILTLPDVQRGDASGYHKCIVRNKYGEKVSQRAYLLIQGTFMIRVRTCCFLCNHVLVQICPIPSNSITIPSTGSATSHICDV